MKALRRSLVLLNSWSLIPRVLFFLVLCSPAQAAWDYSLGLGGRTLPQGGALSGELGYGKIFWGEKTYTGYKYGYLRPHATVQTTVIWNRADVGIDFFPISFAGITAGYAENFRQSQIDTINCQAVMCQGVVDSPYVRAKLLLGAGAFALGFGSELDFLAPWDGSRVFADESSALIGTQGGDTLWWNWVYGIYRFNDKFGVGPYFIAARMLQQGSQNDSESIFFRYTEKNLTINVGAGVYESDTRIRSFTAYATATLSVLPSVSLTLISAQEQTPPNSLNSGCTLASIANS